MKSFHIMLLLVTVKTCFTDHENVARRGKPFMSSHIQFPFGYAALAIDGNRNPNYDEGSCTATKLQKDPWFRLDLMEPYVITAITVANRGDCCHERLEGAEVRVGYSLFNNGNNNTLVATLPLLKAAEVYTMNFTELEGRYVNVFLPGADKYLTLCELEVYGHRATTGVNLALHAHSTQSSTYSFGESSHAHNGERNSEFTPESCQHTKKELSPWWRLDLGHPHKIQSVNVTNRLWAPHRLDGAEIRIGDSLVNHGNNNPRCAVVSSISGSQTKGFDCHQMHGRYVNIVIPGRTEFLHVCEVEVYGSLLK